MAESPVEQALNELANALQDRSADRAMVVAVAYHAGQFATLRVAVRGGQHVDNLTVDLEDVPENALVDPQGLAKALLRGNASRFDALLLALESRPSAAESEERCHHMRVLEVPGKDLVQCELCRLFGVREVAGVLWARCVA
jgi:hypothetical protein